MEGLLAADVQFEPAWRVVGQSLKLVVEAAIDS
jgi:hypothetical protein